MMFVNKELGRERQNVSVGCYTLVKRAKYREEQLNSLTNAKMLCQISSK